jgi:hypothetical protein
MNQSSLMVCGVCAGGPLALKPKSVCVLCVVCVSVVCVCVCVCVSSASRAFQVDKKSRGKSPRFWAFEIGGGGCARKQIDLDQRERARAHTREPPHTHSALFCCCWQLLLDLAIDRFIKPVHE